MEESNLMTVSQFNAKVVKWAMKIRRDARATLAANTHGTGNLSNWLYQYVDRNNRDKQLLGAPYKVAFSFPRYGVFRAYGAGRGWVVRNGTPTRGFRIRSDRDIKQHRWSDWARRLQQTGYTTREINSYKVYSSSSKQSSAQRTPLDWIDQHIQRTAPELADITANFYADRALSDFLEVLSKTRIRK